MPHLLPASAPGPPPLLSVPLLFSSQCTIKPELSMEISRSYPGELQLPRGNSWKLSTTVHEASVLAEDGERACGLSPGPVALGLGLPSSLSVALHGTLVLSGMLGPQSSSAGSLACRAQPFPQGSVARALGPGLCSPTA